MALIQTPALTDSFKARVKSPVPPQNPPSCHDLAEAHRLLTNTVKAEGMGLRVEPDDYAAVLQYLHLLSLEISAEVSPKLDSVIEAKIVTRDRDIIRAIVQEEVTTKLDDLTKKLDKLVDTSRNQETVLIVKLRNSSQPNGTDAQYDVVLFPDLVVPEDHRLPPLRSRADIKDLSN
ncbi:unnamed protein product [Cyclocybe aegerita]|uniref:Mug135-like C-terminal domain-containing protein n=1 Tax=Cyclocybe aegerita TaxID=1973307 RepID=A0A8S0VS77_CYCAE|nr:unnamed protein product [Cyclocybe aegerita]